MSKLNSKKRSGNELDNQQLNEGLSNDINQYHAGSNKKAMHFEGYREKEAKPDIEKQKKKAMKRKRTFLKIVIVIICIIAALIVGFFVLRAQGKTLLRSNDIAGEEVIAPEGAEIQDEGKTIVYNGEKYRYNDNIAAILCIGIDREGYNDTDIQIENGMADTLFLMVIDTEVGNTTMIPISRYSMVMVDEYDMDGLYYGQEEMQICYAYAYGDGKQQSAENTAKAASRLLYGMPISGYVTLDMSAVSVLNDAVGGVTVTVNEDMPFSDPEFYAGNTITLTGQQALSYVRYRISEAVEGYDFLLDNNAPRMERQIQFLSGLLNEILTQTKSDPTLPLTIYNMLGSYMVTDVTASEVTYLITLMAQHGLDNEVISIPATTGKGEYTEVYVDNEALYKIVLDVFYDKAEED